MGYASYILENYFGESNLSRIADQQTGAQQTEKPYSADRWNPQVAARQDVKRQFGNKFLRGEPLKSSVQDRLRAYKRDKQNNFFNSADVKQNVKARAGV